jgi:hypothetical protein
MTGQINNQSTPHRHIKQLITLLQKKICRRFCQESDPLTWLPSAAVMFNINLNRVEEQGKGSGLTGAQDWRMLRSRKAGMARSGAATSAGTVARRRGSSAGTAMGLLCGYGGTTVRLLCGDGGGAPLRVWRRAPPSRRWRIGGGLLLL